MRIVSLLPSTTEIVAELGLGTHLVGRSHECDYPSTVTSLPVCTEPKYKTDRNSLEIHQQIKSILETGLSVYKVDADCLAELEPDIILTQDHCEVCAASLTDVEKAVSGWLKRDVEVISVSPENLEDIFESIKKIAHNLEVETRGEELVSEMQGHMEVLKRSISDFTCSKPEVICIEWLDPLMTAGNWIPELITTAGGISRQSEAGKHSAVVNWKQIISADPDILLLSPCGYAIEDTMNEISILTSRNGWKSLKAVKQDAVYILDGNHYFNRPGPRIADSASILSEIFYPDQFGSSFRGNGWVNLFEQPVRS